jgi:hypothetical protein
MGRRSQEGRLGGSLDGGGTVPFWVYRPSRLIEIDGAVDSADAASGGEAAAEARNVRKNKEAHLEQDCDGLRDDNARNMPAGDEDRRWQGQR